MNLEILLLFGGLIFVLGAIAGYLVSSFGREDASKNPPEQPPAQSTEPATQPPAPGAAELVRLWRDPQSSKVIFQAPDGDIIDSSAAKKMLQQVFSQPAVAEQPTTDVKAPAPASPKQAEQTRSMRRLESLLPPPGEVEPVKVSPIESLSRAFQKPKVTAPRSIAAQIDDILQERIAGSELARRGLRLLDLPDHDLGVVLDLRTYSGIDAVPDQAVQQAIREAVAEWQNRYK